jgi:hypothetical protein
MPGIKGLWHSLGALRKWIVGCPPEDDGNIETPKELEISLRCRAKNCRTFSILFLLIIIITIGAAAMIAYGLYQNAGIIQDRILTQIANRLQDQISSAKATQEKISPEIETAINDVVDYLTGAGVDWKPVDSSFFRKGGRVSLEKYQENGLMALVNKGGKIKIWKSNDKGLKWEAGAEFEAGGWRPWHYRKGDYLLVVARDPDKIVLLGKTGVFIREIDLNDADSDDFSSRISQIFEKYYVRFRHSRKKNISDLLIAKYDNGDMSKFDMPVGFTSHFAFHFGPNNDFKLVGYSDKNDLLIWTLDQKQEKWSAPASVPKADIYESYGDGILLFDLDPDNGKANIRLWGYENNIIAKGELILDEKEKSYLNDKFKPDKNVKKQTWLGSPVSVRRINDEYMMLTIGKGLCALMNKTTDGELNFTKLPPDSSLVGDGILLVKAESGNTLKYIGPNGGGLQDGLELPNTVPAGDRVRVVRRGKDWLILSFTNLSGAREIVIDEWLAESKKWQRRHPPSDLIPGDFRSSWEYELFDDFTIVLANQTSEGESIFLRCPPHKIPKNIDSLLRRKPYKDRAHVFGEARKYLYSKKLFKNIEHWPGNEILRSNLNLFFSMQDDLENYKNSLNDIPEEYWKDEKDQKQAKNKPPNIVNPPKVTTDKWWHILSLALVRFLLLGLVFFVAKIFVNLYRYYLRLSAFYEARADGIALAAMDEARVRAKLPDKLNDLFDSLSPDEVDMGAPPKSPAMEVAEAASKVAKASADLAAKVK